jgi:hypothetical protein
VLTRAQLDHLDRWCEDLATNAALVGNRDPSMAVRCVTMQALIAQARFGIGFATIQQQKFYERARRNSKNAQARWAKPGARERQAELTTAQHARARAHGRAGLRSGT